MVQLNCSEKRFQFFNLHAYGKTGVIVAHMFAESEYYKHTAFLADSEIVSEVVSVLQDTFIGDKGWRT